MFAGLSPTQVSNHSSTDPKTILNSFRDALFAAGPSQGEIVITLCPEHAKHLNDAGWGKIQVKDYLYEIAVRKDDEWGVGSIPPGPKPQGKSDTHSAESPDSFTIVVAGGTRELSPTSYLYGVVEAIPDLLRNQSAEFKDSYLLTFQKENNM